MGYYKSIIEQEQPLHENYLSLSDYKETHPFRFNPKLVRSRDFDIPQETFPQKISPGKILYLNYPKR